MEIEETESGKACFLLIGLIPATARTGFWSFSDERRITPSIKRVRKSGGLPHGSKVQTCVLPQSIFQMLLCQSRTHF